jgi:hypothetical protein
MRGRAILAVLTFASAGAALAACGGGGSSSPAPTPEPTCAPGGQAQLVFPKTGSSVAVSTLNQIVVAVSTPLPSSTTWNFAFSNSATLNSSNFTLSFNSALTIVAPPVGSATPSFPNPIYESVQLVSALPTGITYVYLNNTNSSCIPFGPVGNFTGT